MTSTDNVPRGTRWRMMGSAHFAGNSAQHW
jgi:hypothetical protein